MEEFSVRMSQFVDRLYAKTPDLLAALAIIAVGWLIAVFARRSAKQFANYLNRFLDRNLRRGKLASARVPNSAIAVIGEVLFWAVLLFSLAVAARVAGVVWITAWLDKALTLFPNMVIGVLIMLIGLVIAGRVGAARQISGQVMTRRVLQGLIFAIAMILGLAQIGVDVTILVVLMGVVVGALSLGLSIAFGLGARDYMAATVASRTLAGQLHAGMRIRIDDLEGEIIELTGTHMLLDTPAGQVLTPLSNAMNRSITIQLSDLNDVNDLNGPGSAEHTDND